ncbi:MAG: ABC transporter ATP-binding protein [Planctomycetota bacterium]
MSHSDDSPTTDHASLREGRKTLRRLLPFLRPHRRTALLSLVTVTVTTACELIPYGILKWVIDEAIAAGRVDWVVLAATGNALVFFLGAGVAYVQQIMLMRLGLGIVTALKETIFRHVMALGTLFHDANPVGKLISRTESDAEQIKELFSNIGVQLIRSLALFVGSLGFLLWLHFDVGWVFLPLVPVLAAAAAWFFVTVRRIYREGRIATAELTGMVAEYVQGVPVVQHYAQKERALGILDGRNRAKFRVDMKAWTLDYGFWGVFMYFEIVAIVAIIFLAVPMLGETLPVGSLAVFILLTRKVFEPILGLGEQLNQVQRALASADRVFELLDTPVDVCDEPGARETAPFARELRFEDVCFSYDGETDVLHDVTFTVEKGEQIALVGPSGGGKTTLVGLLCRFMNPTRGRITTDGEDLRRFTRAAWRDHLGLVLQEIYLFPGTVDENLRVLDDSVPRERVVAAAEAVTADRFVEHLPGAYDGELKERGGNLSLGERQILSFARALTRDPSILVLDEATSSVDPETEARIQESLTRLLEGRTAVIVAHRLSTIRNADRILVVVDGRIAEEGDHDALYAAGGRYRELYDLQALENGGGAA